MTKYCAIVGEGGFPAGYGGIGKEFHVNNAVDRNATPLP